MTTYGSEAGGAHFEELACRLAEMDTRPSDGHLLGMKVKISEALDHVMRALFPYHFGKSRARFSETEKRTYELMRAYDALVQVLVLVYKEPGEAEKKAGELLDSLPDILEVLKTDIQACYEGDPAATSTDEVIMTYPSFTAITVYRIAHRLYEMGVPIIPRAMTEDAHIMTGIDIHPGATIGKYFFIDHGTGVVIGGTATIGEHVRIYQHVTLGAKSFSVDEDGNPVKGNKRHPDIGNYVTIYAGASVLGGDTKIGDGCVIGGNVWLTHSLEPGVTIVSKPGDQHEHKPDQMKEL